MNPPQIKSAIGTATGNSITSIPEGSEKRLINFSHSGGCGCKVAPAQLKKLLESVPKSSSHPNLLVGVETSDDAAIYKINDNQALIFTNDFQTPIVDDPYIYGCQAAANAISDVYAMGGTPIMATAIAGFPVNEIEHEKLSEIMRGGVEMCEQANIPLAGGHTIDNPQPIFGLSVVGEAHPNKIKTNSGAKVGDRIIMSRPLGTGVLASALRIDMLSQLGYAQLVHAITQLNSSGIWLGDLEQVSALTDITGFGIAGHLFEMAEGAGVSLRINTNAIPIYSEAVGLAQEGVFPGGAYRNMEAFSHQIVFAKDFDSDRQLVYTDPQTNGGLLITVAPDVEAEVLARLQQDGCNKAVVIGEVESLESDSEYVIFE